MDEDFDPAPPATDLLGDAWLPIKDRRGRRKRRFLDQDYVKVEELVAAGMSQLEIATVMGCDVKTLTKYFSRELDEGTLNLKAEAMSMLREKVKDGNVAAIKAMLALLDKGDLHAPSRRPRTARTEPLGKKAALAEEARRPDKHDGWGKLLQ